MFEIAIFSITSSQQETFSKNNSIKYLAFVNSCLGIMAKKKSSKVFSVFLSFADYK
jgi:hypothetical protein